MRQGGGLFYIPAPQNRDPTAPVLLYDPQRGSSEYFLLEYRTPNPAAGAGYDSQVGPGGLFVWYVQQDANHELVKTTSPFGLTGPNTTPWANWIEGPPAAATPSLPTPGAPWPGGQTTPYLRWNDGTDSPVRVRTRPFQTTDNGIFVEVLTDTPDNATWVDFAFVSVTQLGTFDFPFNNLPAGVAAVGYRGLMKIKTGSGNPTPITITKAMTIEAYGGPVTLGR